MYFSPDFRTAHFVPRSSDRNFERFVNGALLPQPQGAPSVEQDETSWTLSLDVPGVPREELSIGIEGATVRIESRPESRRRVKTAYEMPQEIDVAASQATLENGVLTLKLAKLVPISKVQQLQIS
jgi:HSP20 family protein